MTEPSGAAAGWYPDASSPGMQRYWDGQQWTEHVAPLFAEGSSPVSDTERRAALDAAVARMVAVGYGVEARTDYQAVLISGKPTNHVLHLLICIVTCFLWAPVWLLIAVTNKTTRNVATVDTTGRVSYSF